MPARPRATYAEQRAALDAARAHLRENDTDGYWAALEQQDPYARLARDAAANRGELGRTANARLDRFAAEMRGRPLDDAERAAIRREVATADLAQREHNLAETGFHRITGPQSVDYHNTVFGQHDIPGEAYFPAVVQPSIGSNWGYLAGITLRDAPSRIDLTEIPIGQIADWGERDWKPASDRLLHEERAAQSKTLPARGLMQIEGFHADPQQAAPAAPAPTPQQGSDAPPSFAARLAALPPAPERWLAFTLAKTPAELDLADLHALQAHDAYLKPQHSQHDAAFALVSGAYRHLYGDGPQAIDATGRPVADATPRGQLDATQPGTDERRRAEALRDFGRQLDARRNGLDAMPDGSGQSPHRRLTAALQRGLNDLLWPDRTPPGPAEAARRPYRGGPVLIDGQFGPVTGQALDRAEAGSMLPELLRLIDNRIAVPPAIPASPPVAGLAGGPPPEEFFYAP